jgi:pyruvate dehydrogenase E2 component (dihydrolipoamide acetyltransferase)
LLVKALASTLTEMPEMNRAWAQDGLLCFEQVDIGMVVETAFGLRVPVLRDLGSASLQQIAAAALELVGRARAGALTADDVGGGVISISNLGMFGVASLTPIINPPNSMILGVGALQDVFRPNAQGSPELRREITLTLACDHRILDGSAAARFLSELSAILASPSRLLSWMQGSSSSTITTVHS